MRISLCKKQNKYIVQGYNITVYGYVNERIKPVHNANGGQISPAMQSLSVKITLFAIFHQGGPVFNNTTSIFYPEMHNSAKRGIAIACRPSVRLSVCLSVTLVDQDHIGWKSWKLIARTISPTFALHSLKAIHPFPGERGKF